MTGLLATVFLASLAGSLHCAGMCGAFVAITVGAERRGPAAHVAAQLAYHGGRLTTYALLGAAAGALGAALDLTGAVFGLQRVALAAAGASMILFGVWVLLRATGVRLPRLRAPRPLHALFTAGCRTAMSRPPAVRALLIGLLTTLLPCGWLYAFAAAAAGTGSAGRGALVMVAFWLGTLPVLAGLGAGIKTLAGPLRAHVPTATALALITVGLVAVFGRFNVPALAAPPVETIDETIARVETIDAGDLPCCPGDE